MDAALPCGLRVQINVVPCSFVSGRHGPFPGRASQPFQFSPLLFDEVFTITRSPLFVFAESALNEASKCIICWPVELLASDRASCFWQFVFAELAFTLAFMIDAQATRIVWLALLCLACKDI